MRKSIVPPPTPMKKRLDYERTPIPDYTIKKFLADGSFYKVYISTKNTIIRKGRRQINGRKEERILNLLHGDFINNMIQYWCEEGFPCFEMEYCQEGTLEMKMEKKGYPGIAGIWDGDEKIIEGILEEAEKSNSISPVTTKKINNIDGPVHKRENVEYEETIKNSNEDLVSAESGSVLDSKVNYCESIENSSNLEYNGDDSRTPNCNFNVSLNDSFSGSIVNTLKNNLHSSTNSEYKENESDKLFELLEKSQVYQKDENISLSEDMICSSVAFENSETDSICEIFQPSDIKIEIWIVDMMYQVSKCLEYIHSKGVVHLDIKPSNILISKGKYKICDFNISQMGEGIVRIDGDGVYMAPEILLNNCFYTSDVYSLGVIYLALCNPEKKIPRGGEKFHDLRCNRFGDWRLDQIGRKMLEKNPQARCSSRDLVTYFENLLKNIKN